VGGPTAITIAPDNSYSVSCYQSAKIVSGPYAGYGHWIGFTYGLGAHAVAAPTFHAPAGVTKFKMWYKISATLSTDLAIDEGYTNGGDGEARTMTVTLVAGGWTQLVIPLASFGPGAGNGIFDTQDIYDVWMYHNGPYPSYTLYIDDIEFTP